MEAEIFFDGEEITKVYLHKDPQFLSEQITKVKELKTDAEIEKFLLDHGEGIIDTLGQEVDRIEMDIKKQIPEVKHIDLEMYFII